MNNSLLASLRPPCGIQLGEEKSQHPEKFNKEKEKSVFSRLRRDRSRSPKPKEKGRGMFKRLGSRGKSVFARSDSHNQSSYSKYIDALSEIEDSGGGHWKSRSKKKKLSKEEDDLSQPWVCEEVDPFTPRIRYFDFPKTRIPSHIKTYDGNEDSEDHLKIFQTAAKTERWAMQTWCHMFNSPLTGSKKCIKDPIELHNIKQRDRNSTEDFERRYNLESRDVKGAPECIRISGFMYGITNPKLIKRLHDKIPKMVDEMMRVTTSFLRGEVAASNHERKKSFPPWKQQESSHRQNFKKGGFRSQQRPERKQDRFTLLTKTPKEIFAFEKGKFKAPPPMTTLVKNQNHAKFYEFHGEVGHTTDECMHQKKQIEEMLMAGKLSHLIKEIKHNSGMEQPKVAKKGEPLGKDNAESQPSISFVLLWSQSQPLKILGKGEKVWEDIQVVPGRLVPLEYALVSGSEGTLLANKPTVEERIKVAINPEYPKQTVMIGSTLTEEGRNKLNLEVFVDDLVIKSRTEDEIVRDIEEMFQTLREINMKLNLKKCTFRIEEGMFLGYKVSTRGLKVCLDKVDAVLSLPSLKCLKDVQKLNGKLASLNRFLAKSAEKSLPFFKTLKKCMKKREICWTAKAEEAFKQMNRLIVELPMLVALMEKEELIMYLAPAKEMVSAVLMTMREAKQMPVYFISRALRGPKINYTSMEKLVLALVHASKRLKRYFQAYPIIVITNQPIQQVLSRLEVARRLQKWSIKLGEYAIYYKARVSVKGQILADFIVKRPEEDSPDTLMEEAEELLEPWILFTDGSSYTDGSGARLILTNPEGMEFTYALRFKFDAINNEVPRSENKKVDALSKIASTSFAHLSKQVLVEEQKEKSISTTEVLAIVEEEGDT
ncbi:reverse transcriptase domain-containing protein [Tanacetum coccineum]